MGENELASHAQTFRYEHPSCPDLALGPRELLRTLEFQGSAPLPELALPCPGADACASVSGHGKVTPHSR